MLTPSQLSAVSPPREASQDTPLLAGSGGDTRSPQRPPHALISTSPSLSSAASADARAHVCLWSRTKLSPLLCVGKMSHVAWQSLPAEIEQSQRDCTSLKASKAEKVLLAGNGCGRSLLQVCSLRKPSTLLPAALHWHRSLSATLLQSSARAAEPTTGLRRCVLSQTIFVLVSGRQDQFRKHGYRSAAGREKRRNIFLQLLYSFILISLLNKKTSTSLVKYWCR